MNTIQNKMQPNRQWRGMRPVAPCPPRTPRPWDFSDSAEELVVEPDYAKALICVLVVVVVVIAVVLVTLVGGEIGIRTIRRRIRQAINESMNEYRRYQSDLHLFIALFIRPTQLYLTWVIFLSCPPSLPFPPFPSPSLSHLLLYHFIHPSPLLFFSGLSSAPPGSFEYTCSRFDSLVLYCLFNLRSDLAPPASISGSTPSSSWGWG